MTDKNTATIRTTWNAALIAAAVWVADRWLNITIDVSDPTFVAAVVVVAGIGYRASLELADWLASYPVVGRILFGKAKPPTY